MITMFKKNIKFLQIEIILITISIIAGMLSYASEKTTSAVISEDTVDAKSRDTVLRIYREDPNPDRNGDGVVDIEDIVLVRDSFGSADADGDYNGDGQVDVSDLAGVGRNFGSMVQILNRLPTVYNFNTLAQEDSGQVSALILSSDGDGDDLTYRVVNHNLPVEPSIVGDKISVDLPIDVNGAYEVSIIANDGFDDGPAGKWVLKVLPQNDAPYFTSVPDLERINSWESLEFRLEADDVDGDFLSYSLEDVPLGLDIKDLGDGVFRITANKAGSFSFKGKVSDGSGLFDTVELELIVDEAFSVPVEINVRKINYSLAANRAVLLYGDECKILIDPTDEQRQFPTPDRVAVTAAGVTDSFGRLVVEVPYPRIVIGLDAPGYHPVQMIYEVKSEEPNIITLPVMPAPGTMSVDGDVSVGICRQTWYNTVGIFTQRFDTDHVIMRGLMVDPVLTEHQIKAIKYVAELFSKDAHEIIDVDGSRRILYTTSFEIIDTPPPRGERGGAIYFYNDPSLTGALGAINVDSDDKGIYGTVMINSGFAGYQILFVEAASTIVLREINLPQNRWPPDYHSTVFASSPPALYLPPDDKTGLSGPDRIILAFCNLMPNRVPMVWDQYWR